MGALDVEAVYDHGILKLSHELPLAPGQRVTVTVRPVKSPTSVANSPEWKGKLEDLDYLIMSSDNDPLETA